jgi:signal transduction histidine kinase
VRALQLEASDFIAKPITADGLLVAVQRAKERILTRQKLQENQINLLHKDKMMSLGRLAASVAHEINNPLAGVLNYLRLMRRMLGDQSPSAEQGVKFKTYLDTIEQEIDRCSRIVANLLTFSRKSDVVRVSVDMADVIERSLMLCSHRLAIGHIVVDLDIMGPLPMVKGDPNQLQQCLINLIFNAADAMPDGGRLAVKGFVDNNDNKVVVTVADNGCGIADRDLPHIFEPFFTTKLEGQGTGLGLATTYGIIERLNGTIDVKSRSGHGTTFKIMLSAEK